MLYLKVLGDPVLQGPDGPITGRAAYKRRIALLAVLGTARGRPVGRERLIGLLWPEHSSDAARHNLSETLYVLRKELGEEVFVSLGDEVALAPAAMGSDVATFEEALEAGRLEDAAAAYGGPLLDGFYVSDAPEFERWVDGERDRLARACGQALERLAVAAEEAGRPLAAVEWWRRLAAHDPYSSRVALRLAQALDAAGERPAALRACAAHAARMREELGIDPDPALDAFLERLRCEPRPARATSRVAEPPGPAASPPSSPDPLPSENGVSAPFSPSEAPTPSDPPPAQPLGRGESAAERTWEKHVRRRYSATALAATAGLVAAVVALSAPTRPARDETPVERYDPRRIAVLYFDDESPDGGLGYLARALTGTLTEELSRVPALDVVSRNAVKAYRDGQVGYDSLVQALRVGSVVEGAVQRAGDSVRVTVQLVDTNRQAYLESRTIVRPLGNLFALEAALGEEVSGFLRRRLGQEVRLRQAAAETRSARALELVLRGEEAREQAAALARGDHPLDDASAVRLLARADSFLIRAQQADPGWSRPAVLRGFVALDRAGLASGAAQTPHLQAAERFAQRVLADEPRNAPALELRGRAASHAAVLLGDTASQSARLNGAERDLRAAVDADSTLTSGWLGLSVVLRLRGRLAESDLAARRALAQDAWLENADDVLQRLFFGSLAQGDHPGARQACGQGSAQFPGDWRFVECGLVLMREDPALPPDVARAWALAAELDRLDPPARARGEGRAYSPLFRRAAVAAVLARAGQGDSARAVLARVRAQAGADPELRIPLLFDEARVALLLGDRAGARRLLDAYLAEHPSLRPYLARDQLFRDLLAQPPAR